MGEGGDCPGMKRYSRPRVLRPKHRARIVFKAHSLLYHPTLGLRVIKKRRRNPKPEVRNLKLQSDEAVSSPLRTTAGRTQDCWGGYCIHSETLGRFRLPKHSFFRIYIKMKIEPRLFSFSRSVRRCHASFCTGLFAEM